MEAIRDFLKGLVSEEAPKDDAPKPPKPTSSKITLHVYDFLEQGLNGMLRQVGTGGFHCGVEVYGKEWSFRRTLLGTGIYWYPPKSCTAHKYRESVPMGKANVTEEQFLQLIHKLKKEWPGSGYDILRRNCCVFSNELCQKLGVGTIPDWITNLAGVGADLRSVVRRPLRQMEEAVFGEEPQPESRSASKASSSRAGHTGRPSSRRDGYEKLDQGGRRGLLEAYGPGAILVMMLLGLCALAGAAGAGRLPGPAWAGGPHPQQQSGAAAPAIPSGLRPRFDCDRGFDTWVVSWSLRQSAWCCEKRGRGCTASNALSFHCEVTGPGGFEDWSLFQLDWCCIHSQVGCATLANLVGGRGSRQPNDPKASKAAFSRQGDGGERDTIGTSNTSSFARHSKLTHGQAWSSVATASSEDPVSEGAVVAASQAHWMDEEAAEGLPTTEPAPPELESLPAAEPTAAPDVAATDDSRYEATDGGLPKDGHEEDRRSERLAKHAPSSADDSLAPAHGASDSSSGSDTKSGVSANSEAVASTL